MAKKLTQAEKIAKISPEQLGYLKGESGKKKLISYLRTLRTGYNRRVGAFSRKGLTSYAQISLEKSSPASLRGVQLNKLTRNQLIFEIVRYQKFFNDATSSEAGIKKVNREQDARIFGTDKRGRPLNTMSQEEREEYWDFYDEFKAQNKEWSGQPYSETIQQSLADLIFSEPGFKSLSLAEKLKRAKHKFERDLIKTTVEDMPNVYSGRGPIK